MEREKRRETKFQEYTYLQWAPNPQSQATLARTRQGRKIEDQRQCRAQGRGRNKRENRVCALCTPGAFVSNYKESPSIHTIGFHIRTAGAPLVSTVYVEYLEQPTTVVQVVWAGSHGARPDSAHQPSGHPGPQPAAANLRSPRINVRQRDDDERCAATRNRAAFQEG
jgi:hypothetical protein